MPPYTDLSPDEQTNLDNAIRRLLSEGLIWREEENDRRAYNVLARRRELAAERLRTDGWEMIHHDSLEAFQLIHRTGKHHRKLDRNTTFCLLVLRLLYCEMPSTFAPNPVVAVNDIARRCAAFVPDDKKIDLAEALPILQSLKLIRAAGGKTLRPNDGEQLIELLPTLELAVPDPAIEQLHRQLTTPVDV
ncbi:MAG TPA: DUF4194 domain-containing protein [Anaerolineales bacterium]|nr:DUF4194 domain-containing protein [Anaerolineales bacterium]